MTPQPSTEPPTRSFKVRSLTVPVYLPNLLFAIGQGAAIPIIPLLALELGATPAMAGAIVAVRGLGTLLFDVPAGGVVSRLGDKRSMALATVALAGIALAIGLGPSLPAYAILVFLMGCAWSVWTLARLTYATESAPPVYRGRVMSMMGGTIRLGQLIGPLLGTFAVARFGLAGPFVLQAGLAVAAAISLLLSRVDNEQGVPPAEIGSWDVAREHWRTFLTAGSVAVAVQVLRSAKQTVIPLWGDHIGLTAEQISLIFGASAAMEVIVFYPMGAVMDRRGRKWAAMPFLSMLSAALFLVPLTGTFQQLMWVGLAIGLANGMGAGVNMTLASDLSPALGRSRFFGIWRFIGDLGTVGGPLLVAGITSVVALAGAPIAVALVGVAGSVVLWRAVPETLGTER